MWRLSRLVLVAAALLPHAIKAVYYPSYPGFDDAFIHLRIAENVALGRGWGVNAFEPINVSSSPLFTLLLTFGRWLTTADIAFGMVASAVATSAAVAAAYSLTRMTGSSAKLALLPPLVFATNVHLWRWNATVMEPTLACLMLALAIAAFFRAQAGPPVRFTLFGLAVGLAFVTRFELGLLLPAGAIALFPAAAAGPANRAWFLRQCGWTLLGFLPLAVAWIVFGWVAFGAILPTTFHSKAASMSLPNVATVRSIAMVTASSLWAPTLLAGALVCTVMRKEGWVSVKNLCEPFLLPTVFAVLCIAFYALAVKELQSAARYLLPTLYALSLALGGVIARGLDRGLLSLRFVVSAAALHLGVMLAINHLAVAPVLSGFRDNYWSASRQAADYLASAAKPGDTVFAVSDIGILAYYSRDRYRIVDGPGLATPTLATLQPAERFRLSRARFVVEHYGEAGSEWFFWGPPNPYPRVRAIRFAAAGLVSAKGEFSLNIYERRER